MEQGAAKREQAAEALRVLADTVAEMGVSPEIVNDYTVFPAEPEAAQPLSEEDLWGGRL